MITTNGTAIRRLLAHARLRTLLTYLIAGLLSAAAIVLVGHEIRHHVEAIEAWITSLGPWGVPAFVGLFIVATSLLVPESVLSIIAGVLFGLPWGLTAVVGGNILAAALQYVLARKVLRRRIERVLASRPSLVALQGAFGRNELRMQALVRLTPVNPATLSYMFGAVGVRFAGFLLACLAFVPHMFIEVYFGYAATHVARMAGRSTHAVYTRDLIVFGGLAVTAFVVVFVSKKAHQAVIQSVSGTGTGKRGTAE